MEIRNSSLSVEKYFTSSLRSLVKYFSTIEEKFRISALSCNILYLFNANIFQLTTEITNSEIGKAMSLCAMHVWRISKENGIFKNYLWGPKCTRAT